MVFAGLKGETSVIIYRSRLVCKVEAHDSLKRGVISAIGLMECAINDGMSVPQTLRLTFADQSEKKQKLQPSRLLTSYYGIEMSGEFQ